MKKQFFEAWSFQAHIRSWRETHRRDFPRRRTTDPYKIWISETMLAQTQASRVVNYYKEWMRSYPCIQDLATLSKTEILSARSGLGYNSRALRILEAAKQIVTSERSNVETGEKSSSIFPHTYEDLIALPWVGDYTANAILAFAYNLDVAVVDTNIRRILIYHFDIAQDATLWELKAKALEILPRGYARPWYNALMDYGALELTARKTGIRPLTRQSKFEGSSRQVRARIVKQILEHPVGSLEYSSIQEQFPDRKDLEDIIQKLIQESVIVSQGNGFAIHRDDIV